MTQEVDSSIPIDPNNVVYTFALSLPDLICDEWQRPVSNCKPRLTTINNSNINAAAILNVLSSKVSQRKVTVARMRGMRGANWSKRDFQLKFWTTIIDDILSQQACRLTHYCISAVLVVPTFPHTVTSPTCHRSIINDAKRCHSTKQLSPVE